MARPHCRGTPLSRGRSRESVSDRTLALRLKELERADLVSRTVEPTAPVSVHYGLTARGQELLAALRPPLGTPTGTLWPAGPHLTVHRLTAERPHPELSKPRYFTTLKDFLVAGPAPWALRATTVTVLMPLRRFLRLTTSLDEVTVFTSSVRARFLMVTR